MMRSLGVIIVFGVICAPLDAQQPTDTVRLGALTSAALHADPRFTQIELQQAQSALRMRDIDAEKFPTLTIESFAQYQSEVTRLPITLPGNPLFPVPRHDTYDARLSAQQRLLDPGKSARRRVERAQLEESNARVRAALFARRQEVNDAFFSAVLLQDRAGEIEAVISDLQARLRETEIRLRERAALPGDAAALEAEILRRRQDVAELTASRSASVNVLRELTGVDLKSASMFATPDLSNDFNRLRAMTDVARMRPEYEQFARTRERIEQQRSLIGAQEKPRVSAFARVGYGEPALNFLSRSFDTYWVTGVQLQWTPWRWGTSGREREALQIQQQIVATEEAAFSSSVRRTIERDVANVDRLRLALQMDDRIIALREGIERESRIRYDEGVITVSEYVDRRNDVLAARIARVTHRAELAQSQVRYLTTIGLEVTQ